nr:hypothetical protein [Tanacetum cinerariifolium]
MRNNIMSAGSRIIYRCLQQDDIYSGDHVQAVAATDDSPAFPEHTTVRNCGKLLKGYNKVNPSTIKMSRQTYFGNLCLISSTTSARMVKKEVNKLCAERLARNANPLALVATTQANQDSYYQTSKSQKSYAPSSKPSIPTRSHTTTRYKGKEIAKPFTPPSESASKEDSDPEQAQRDKDMQNNLALIAKYFKRIYKPTNNNLKTSSNSRNKNVDTTPRYKNDNQSGQFRNQRTMNVAGARENVGSLVVQQSGIQCFNCKEFGHFAKECRKPKRVKDSAYHKEKMFLCKQAEKAHYNYMEKIQEVPTANSGTDSEPLEQVQNDTGYNVFANDLQHSEQSESISNISQRDKDMQKNLALIAKYFKRIYKPTNNNLRTSSNSRNKNVDSTLRYKNDNQSGQFGNQRTMNVAGARENKAKRVKDSVYHKEKMLLCKQAEKAHYSYMAKIQEVPTADSGTDSEPLEQVQNDTRYNVFANDLQHSEQSKSISNTCIMETCDSNVIPDSPDMCEDDIQNDQNDVESDDERVALANLITNLKLDVDENKKIQKQLKKANTTFAQELKECKTILAKTSKTLGESNSVWDSCLVALQNKQTEFEKYKAFNDHTVDYDKLEQIVDNAWVKHTKDQFRAPTAQDMNILIKRCLMPLALKTQNDSFIFLHEIKQEMHADLKYVESLEKETDELESDKAEFSNMYDMILQECVSNEVMCTYFLSLSDLDALAELQCLYLHKVKECDCLAQKLSKQIEYVSKEVYTELLRRFTKLEKHLISFELALQQCQEQ